MRTLILIVSFSLLGLALSGCGQKRPANQVEAAQKAIAALEKVAAATETARNYDEYATIVIDAKTRMDRAAIGLPSDEFYQEISSAMKAYIDAGLAWDALNTRQFQEWYLLAAKYSIPPNPDQTTNQKEILKTIWADARRHLDRASALLKQ